MAACKDRREEVGRGSLDYAGRCASRLRLCCESQMLDAQKLEFSAFAEVLDDNVNTSSNLSAYCCRNNGHFLFK